MLHYSQKRRYYFFIAIAKFKTILSYYPRWRKLSPYCLSFAQPSLNLRSTFAQPSPPLAQACATLAPHLRHTCATHFGKLSEFAKVNQLPRWRKFPPPNAYPSPNLRSTFAQGSMRRINIPPSPLQKGGRCRSSTFKDFLDSFCVAQSYF